MIKRIVPAGPQIGEDQDLGDQGPEYQVEQIDQNLVYQGEEDQMYQGQPEPGRSRGFDRDNQEDQDQNNQAQGHPNRETLDQESLDQWVEYQEGQEDKEQS